MNCDLVRQSIPLYYYGELAPEEEELFEDHLAACQDCREEVERHQAIALKVSQRGAEPPPGLLAECRAGLMQTIQSGAAATPVRQPGWWASVLDSFHGWTLLTGSFRLPAGAVALLALGFFTGRFTNSSPAGLFMAGLAPDAVVSNVRYIQPDRSGRVRIALDETRQRVVDGPLGDQSIQRLLLAAMRAEGNPGVKVESIEMLKGSASSEGVREALVEAVLSDPDAGVRAKALESLKNVSADQAIRHTLAQVLMKESDPGIRIQAIDLLTTHRDGSLVGLLQNVVNRDSNDTVRTRCQSVLRAMKASEEIF